MYHSVGSHAGLNRAERKFTVKPRDFERQMELLKKKGYTTITFAELDQLAISAAPLDKKYVMITFDDGYADNFEHAFPILREFDFKGVFFIVTELVGGWNMWDLHKGFKKKALLNRNEMIVMKKHGMEFQPHSTMHGDLSMLESGQIKKEVKCCAGLLKTTMLNDDVLAFAYPFGRYNDEVMNALKRCGIKYGVTLKRAIAKPGKHDNLSLPRLLVHGEHGLFDFLFRLTFGYSAGLFARL
jgi:peptidoglycan/xylan/chitin deacetylase (PgdA/CDA1 family)